MNGLASVRRPRTQLTKVKIEISVRGRRTEAMNGCVGTNAVDLPMEHTAKRYPLWHYTDL